MSEESWSLDSGSLSSSDQQERSSSAPSSETNKCMNNKTKKNHEMDSIQESSSSSSSSSIKKAKKSWLSRWIQSINEFIEEEGIEFRSRLSSCDIQDIQRARFLFHWCSILPPFIYYFGGSSDKPTKFPASISFTIRKGLPQKTQLLLWTAGWSYMYRVIKRSGSDMIQKFTIKMFLTGIWTTVLFKLGRNRISDGMHFMGAGIYMADHIILLKLLNISPIYRKAFYGSFLALLTSIGRVRRLEQFAKLPTESETTPRHRAIQLARLPNQLQNSIFWAELLLMISENLLFTSFVDGMPSGLLLPKNNNDDENDKFQLQQQQQGLLLERKGDTVPLEEDEDDVESLDEFVDACDSF